MPGERLGAVDGRQPSGRLVWSDPACQTFGSWGRKDANFPSNVVRAARFPDSGLSLPLGLAPFAQQHQRVGFKLDADKSDRRGH
jgi:hypothetical protein